MRDIIDHYDKLIDENNDPTRDPQPLRDYMDEWDGEKFLESMRLDKNKSVLEIGVGTGRIAIKVVPLCLRFVGIDISPKTILRARENLSSFRNIELICDDFCSFVFTEHFDVIYSSLTFMHMEHKLSVVKKIASLLNENGLFVISIDKNQSDFIDMGTRKIRIYPDNKADMTEIIIKVNLKLVDQFETEHAYVMVSKKPSPVGEGGPLRGPRNEHWRVLGVPAIAVDEESE